MRRRQTLKTVRFAVLRGLLLCAIVLPTLILFKLAGLIGWSWWWVFIPLWIPLGIILAILAGFAVMSAVIAAAAIFAEMSEKY